MNHLLGYGGTFALRLWLSTISASAEAVFHSAGDARCYVPLVLDQAANMCLLHLGMYDMPRNSSCSSS